VCHINVSIYLNVGVGGRIVPGMQELPVYFSISALIIAAAVAVPFVKKVFR